MLDINFIFLKSYQNLSCGQACHLSWKMVHVHLKRMWILLPLDGIYKVLPVLLCHLRSVFPYFLLKNFYWNIIALQCFSFCWTMKWISYMYTYMSSLLDVPPTPHPIPPTQVITEHWAELPMLYSRFPLSDTWSCIQVNPNLPISPTLPFPSCSHCSLCLHQYFCLGNWFICTVLLDSTYMHYYAMFVILFDLLHSVWQTGSIHISTNDPISFLLVAESIV